MTPTGSMSGSGVVGQTGIWVTRSAVRSWTRPGRAIGAAGAPGAEKGRGSGARRDRGFDGTVAVHEPLEPAGALLEPRSGARVGEPNVALARGTERDPGDDRELLLLEEPLRELDGGEREVVPREDVEGAPRDRDGVAR